MATSAPDRLDPVGRLRFPRRPTLLRAGLVAGLLLTAAGVLYAGEPPGSTSGPTTAPGPATAPGTTRGSGPAPAGGPLPDPPGRATPAPGPGLAAGPGPGPGPERLPVPAGRVGVPVPLGDPGRIALLRPGDRVDLLAVPAGGGDPVSLATAAPVLAVDHAAATLLLALTPAQAREVLSVPAASSTLAVIVRG